MSFYFYECIIWVLASIGFAGWIVITHRGEVLWVAVAVMLYFAYRAYQKHRVAGDNFDDLEQSDRLATYAASKRLHLRLGLHRVGFAAFALLAIGQLAAAVIGQEWTRVLYFGLFAYLAYETAQRIRLMKLALELRREADAPH